MKELLKALARGIATIFVVPNLLSYAIRRSVMGRDRAVEGSSQALSLIPGLPGQYLRRAFLSRVLDYCAPTAVIGFGAVFSKAGARIEDYVYVGPRCHIGLAHLERDVLLAPGVHVPSGAHAHGTDVSGGVPIREQQGQLRRVRIGAGTWIGSNAVVLADVGRNTVVGAGAVVTRTLPDSVIAAGVPARVVRQRDDAGAVSV